MGHCQRELTEKLVPICELEDGQLHPDGHYAFTRAVVDVSSLKKKLNDMPQELWEVSKYSIEYIAISSYCSVCMYEWHH